MGTDGLLAWEPYCGALYSPARVAGSPVVCDRDAHGADTQHCQSETGFRWW